MLTRTWTVVLLCTVFAACGACSSGTPSTQASSAPATPSIPAPPDVAAPPADATRTPTGLASKVLTPGTGTRHPRPNSQVVVHYTGWTTDGKMFDSSVARGQPASMSLDGVIAGWTEGVQMMVVGEKRRFWIPARLAYEGMDGPQGMLVFDIELIRIES
jgi:FKBP-type peptidyl-prolyl cis-trans isomerase